MDVLLNLVQEPIDKRVWKKISGEITLQRCAVCLSQAEGETPEAAGRFCLKILEGLT